MVALFVLRYLEYPTTFGDTGHFRAANIIEQRQFKPRHGKVGACAECHEDEATARASSPHLHVACESCHAPLADHIRDGEVIAEMPKRKVAELCLNCHRHLEARPANHPQIDLRTHLDDVGAEWATDVCYECHSPHDPDNPPEGS
jgi:hypothetical protein